MNQNLSRTLLVFACVSALSSGASAEEVTRQVTVQGSCLHAVQPDRGSLTVTADFLEKDLPAASKKATDAYERVKTAVKRLDLKNVELTTSEYSFQEAREWEKDRQVFKGFRARMGLMVSTSEINRLGEVIVLAAKEGLRDVSSLNMFLSHELLKAERESCLEDAVRNARAKAESMARAASAKVGRVLTMNELGRTEPGPRTFAGEAAPMLKMAMDSAAAPPSIEAGPTRISTDVSVTFQLQ